MTLFSGKSGKIGGSWFPVEILLAFDIEYTKKLVISLETLVKFKSI